MPHRAAESNQRMKVCTTFSGFRGLHGGRHGQRLVLTSSDPQRGFTRLLLSEREPCMPTQLCTSRMLAIHHQRTSCYLIQLPLLPGRPLQWRALFARQTCSVLHHAMCVKPSPGAPAQSIMLALREGDDETAQLAALNELCELLAVSSEDALSMFPIDTLVPVLVRAVRYGAASRAQSV